MNEKLRHPLHAQLKQHTDHFTAHRESSTNMLFETLALKAVFHALQIQLKKKKKKGNKFSNFTLI